MRHLGEQSSSFHGVWIDHTSFGVGLKFSIFNNIALQLRTFFHDPHKMQTKLLLGLSIKSLPLKNVFITKVDCNECCKIPLLHRY